MPAPGDVQDGSLVTRHQGVVWGHSTSLQVSGSVETVRRHYSLNYLVVGENQEGSSSSRLHDTCDELGVYTAEERVPGGLGDANVVIALLPLEVGTKHVPEL